VLGDRQPTLEDIKKLQMVRLCVAESLRMYPEPPLLIRRALEEHTLPRGAAAFETRIMRGADIFLSIYNIHRSPDLWERPDQFDPERFLRPFKNPKFPEWEGYDPSLFTGLYPNEVAAGFAFLPFGGGSRKCVGDQFALLESTVTLAMLLRRYEFAFVGSPDDVGMKTGAPRPCSPGLPQTRLKGGKGSWIWTC
jgi:cytochrome P450 family 97 subfamily B polypeptide 3